MSDEYNPDEWDPKKWDDEKLLAELTKRYTYTVIPPCCVCGDELTCQRAGGGEPTVYACSGYEDDPDKPGCIRRMEGRKGADEHYVKSEFIDRKGGDDTVMELIARFKLK